VTGDSEVALYHNLPLLSNLTCPVVRRQSDQQIDRQPAGRCPREPASPAPYRL